MKSLNETSTSGLTAGSAGGLNGPCYAKLLVPNSVAGSIIGRNGSEIAAIEKDAQCNIRLSSSESFFPGTPNRSCVVSGTLENINNAIVAILNKIKDNSLPTSRGGGGGATRDPAVQDEEVSTVPEVPERISCTLAVPKSAVSAIIGKGGQTIRSLAENTGAKVVVSERESGLMERLVSFSGSFQAVKSAVLAIVQDTQDDRLLRECCLQLEYRSMNGSEMYNPPSPVMGMGLGMGLGMPPYGGDENVSYPGVRSSVLVSNCELQFQIPDAAVGAIIGKQGSCLAEIMRRSGAKINVSQKGDLVPGTSNRQVTLSGQVVSVHHAHALLWQQFLLSASNQDAQSEYGLHSRHDLVSNSQGSMKSINFDGRAVRHSRSRPHIISPYAGNPSGGLNMRSEMLGYM